MNEFERMTDKDLLNAVDEKTEELERRGYVFGWHKKEEYAGVIYIMVNPAFPHLVKIGYADDVRKRLTSLSQKSSVPDPFHVYATYKVKRKLEDLTLHNLIDFLNPNLRHNANKEFYEMSPDEAYKIFFALAKIDSNEDLLEYNPLKDTYFDTTPETTSDEKADSQETTEKTKRQSKPRMSFEELGIPVGSTLAFSKDPSITCTTIDNINKVDFKGETCTTSAIAKKLLNYPTAQGPLYFTYNDVLLTDIRKQVEARG